MRSASQPRRQCAKCPFKKSTDPHDIPDGYCPKKHAELRRTIAGDDPMSHLILSRVEGLRIMACHESPVGGEVPCVGWLENQLGDGNNIALRVAVSLGRISADYEIDGPQHATLEDTLPKS